MGRIISGGGGILRIVEKASCRYFLAANNSRGAFWPIFRPILYSIERIIAYWKVASASTVQLMDSLNDYSTASLFCPEESHRRLRSAVGITVPGRYANE